MNHSRIPLLAVLFAALPVAAGLGAEDKAADAQKENRAKLEEQFRKTLTDAVLVGHFTLDGKEGLRKEKYHIAKVEKSEGDLWVFHARITYGKNDVTIPLRIPVKWAGDTPVITVDKLFIPGMGTFNARVLIYKDQYIGTWDGGDHGGQMFGKIVHEQKDGSDEGEDAQESAGEKSR